MKTEVLSFDVRSSPDEVLREVHRFSAASLAIDRPNEAARTFEAFVGRLRNPMPGFGDPLRWIALAGARPVGVAAVHFPDAENRHIALLELSVDPALRRRGIGTGMLRALVPRLEASGRTVVESWNVTGGGPGELWAGALGFRTTHSVLVQELLIARVDPVLWDVAPEPEHRLLAWRRRCPDDLVESFARARTAITDAPTGHAGLRAPDWTVARVRAVEQELIERRIELRAVVAVSGVSGEVSGLTLVELHPHRNDWAYQGDTAVLAGHRGRGLGRSMKAAMARSLVAEVPELRRVVTHTATSNSHMIATNHAIGYTDARSAVVLSQTVRALADRLGTGVTASG